jgi:hypothetical protein
MYEKSAPGGHLVGECVFGGFVVDVALAGAMLAQHVQVDLHQPHDDHRQLSFLRRLYLKNGGKNEGSAAKWRQNRTFKASLENGTNIEQIKVFILISLKRLPVNFRLSFIFSSLFRCVTAAPLESFHA